MLNTNSKPVEVKYEDNRILYICPKCKKALTFRKRYQGKSLCIKCGQRLDWSPTNDIFTEVVIAKNSDDAAWIADQYYSIIKAPEDKRLDTDDWRKSLRDRETELYLLFFNRKDYGRFMRARAKNMF